jgi:uncharacterized repeat protein (TIGR03803 family)
MQSKKLSIGLTVVSAILTLAALMTATRAAAQQEKVLHSFVIDGVGGSDPNGGLIADAAGNLYGTTVYGGTGVCGSVAPTGCGVVFELKRNATGGWTEKVLHNFNNDGKDGFYPYAGLAFDVAGNLYGTTGYGGAGVCSSVAPTGCGTVFELMPQTGGRWAEKVLHSFGGGSDGELPEGGLILDKGGNLYGTTAGISYNCTYSPYVDCGTVFKLTPHAGGSWTEKVLHSFNNNGADGYGPAGAVVRDASGNLYGGAYFGGAFGDGAVFELTPGGSGSWTEQVLYSFFYKGNFGGGPGTLILDAAGNLYGTTPTGGTTYSGAVFQLTPAGGGSWTETVLYNFDLYTTGATTSSLIFDSAGNLYGTNRFGGAGTTICYVFGGGNESASCGTAFKLSPVGGGTWSATTLHSFGNGTDGQVPYAGVIRDAAGNLYGTTTSGGTYGGGTVFEVKP